MRNSLATLSLAAVTALMLSACNGNTATGTTGVAPLPNGPAATQHGRAHREDNGPSSLHAGGATFPAYAYNLGNQPVGTWNQPQAPPGQGSIFYAAPTTGTVFYCLTGSGFGRKEFESNNGTATVACAPLGASATGFGARTDPLDFVGSDVAMASTECCASGTTYYNGRLTGSVTWGQPFEFPTIGGPIVFGYNLQYSSFPSTVKLSTWSQCAIANGTIGNWNDGALTADNGGTSLTGGVSEPITFYYRSDSSGTTDIFTNHLNTVCNQTFGAPFNAPPYGSASRSAAWTYGVNSLWPGPTGSQASGSDFIGENGNPGVLAAIQSTGWATGYLEGAWAKSANPKVGQAYLQDGPAKMHAGKWKFANVPPTDKAAVAAALAPVTASAIVYGGGSDGNPLQSTTPWCQLYVPLSNIANPPAGAYPIVGFSYWDFYGNNNGVHVSDKKTLVNFIVSSTANSILSKLEYTALSSSIHTAITNALNGNSSQTACLN